MDLAHSGRPLTGWEDGRVRVSELNVYPIKSAAGMSVASWALDRTGMTGDRAYMVVDADGRFLTQREEPRLALVHPVPGEPLAVHTPAGSAVVVPGARTTVTVWEYTGPALDCGDEVAELLSEHLQRPCRLVTVPEDHNRPTSLGGGAVAFSDGYPLLIASESSLRDLNSRLANPLPMNRFRPNVVVSGAPAFDEDRWLRIEVAGIGIDIVKPCSRCVITRVDQATGVRGDLEPLRTLATFRRAPGGVMFGQNAVHRTVGQLAVGAAVRVVERRS